MLANDRSLAWLCSSDLSNNMKMDIHDLGSTAGTSDLQASVFGELCELRLYHLVPGGGYHRWRGHTTDACSCSVSLPRTNDSLIAHPVPRVFSPGVGLPYVNRAEHLFIACTPSGSSRATTACATLETDRLHVSSYSSINRTGHDEEPGD